MIDVLGGEITSLIRWFEGQLLLRPTVHGYTLFHQHCVQGYNSLTVISATLLTVSEICYLSLHMDSGEFILDRDL